MNNLLSVIVPMYNSEITIEDCINSLINQTYKNLEIIVIDDCSTDNSSQIVKDMNLENDRIKNRVIQNSSRGTSIICFR